VPSTSATDRSDGNRCPSRYRDEEATVEAHATEASAIEGAAVEAENFFHAATIRAMRTVDWPFSDAAAGACPL
jgi:hypothetical protein